MPCCLPAQRSLGTQHQPWAGQQRDPLLPGPKSQLARLGRGTWRQRDESLVPVYGWLAAGTGTGTHPAARGWPPSCNRSWEQLCEPCPASRHQLSPSGGQRWVCRAPGLRSHTLPGQSTHACTGAGRCLAETVPGAMFIPAWVLNGQQLVGGGLSAAAGWQPPPAAPGPRALSWDSSQRPGSGGSGDSYFGQPKAPQLSCSLQHRACAGAGTRVLPWAALGEVHVLPIGTPAPCCLLHPEVSHIPGMRQPGVELTWVTLNPARHLCASQPDVSVPPSQLRPGWRKEQQLQDVQPK